MGLACLVSLVRVCARVSPRERGCALEGRRSARAILEPELVEGVAAQAVELAAQLGSQSGLELQVRGLVERLQECDDVGEILVPARDEFQIDESGEVDDVGLARTAPEIPRLRVGWRARSRAARTSW